MVKIEIWKILTKGGRERENQGERQRRKGAGGRSRSVTGHSNMSHATSRRWSCDFRFKKLTEAQLEEEEGAKVERGI